MARRRPPNAFISVIAARWLTTGEAERALKGAGGSLPRGPSRRRSERLVRLRREASLPSPPAHSPLSDEASRGFPPPLCHLSVASQCRARKAHEPFEFCDRTVGLTLSPLLFQKLSGDGVESIGGCRRPLVFSARRCWAGSTPSFKSRLAASLAPRASRRPVAG